jgi:tetratricopeptide (TPR) repeat protein
MSRSCCAVLACLALFAGCGKRDPHYAQTPTQPSLVRRRADVPFTPQVERPSDDSLATARRIDEIEKLIDDGMHGQAETALAHYFAEGGEHPRAFQLQGKLHYQRGEFDQAIPWLDKAIAMSPRWIDPRIVLARCFFRTDRLAAAEGVFEEIDRLAPKAPWGPYGCGVIAHSRGDSERAAQLLDEALARDRRHVPSLRARADLAHSANEGALEEELLRRWLHEDSNAALAHERLGDLASGAGRRTEALRYYRTSYDLQPNSATARRLAELALLRGDDAEARIWQHLAGIAPAPRKAVPDTP